MSPTALLQVQSAARASLRLFGNYSLADPKFLALLPLVLVLFLWGRARRGRSAGRAPIPDRDLPRSLRQRLAWLPSLAHVLALCLVAVALARPLRGNVESNIESEGVDIALVVDRSGSMQFDDLERGKSRLDVVKEVVGDFARRRMTDREGAADSVALLTFAHYPRLWCPFTLDADALLGFLDQVELVQRREEDGTAIGVALAKAVALLKDSEAKSKVCVLLTDGENNVHDIRPLEAAELAAEEGIRVYTVFAARYQYMRDPLRGHVPTNAELDTSELEGIAELTHGRFFRARDRAGLEDIYAQIEALERTPRTEHRYEETFDLYPWFLLAGLALYLTAWFSGTTWARSIP